jgi:hypothetical protein
MTGKFQLVILQPDFNKEIYSDALEINLNDYRVVNI